MKARLALGGLYRVQGKHEEALMHYAAAYDVGQGKVDMEAVRVEQHEVGFSDKKIGTDNIQQCVAVILHDPVTKKTALAHVDRFTDTSSLSDVIKKFPLGTKLDTYLVGGRDRSDFSKGVSDDNIKRVMDELKKHDNVDIKRADIGDKGAPSGIVFDPQTSELKHAVPGRTDETTDVRKLLLFDGSKNPPLTFAFDLTESHKMNVPILDNAAKESLVHRYLNTPKINNYETQQASFYDPLAKTVEKICKENPEIIISATAKHLDYQLRGIVNQKEQQQTKQNIMQSIEQAVQNPSKSFFAIEQSMQKQVFESYQKPVQQPQKTTFLEKVNKVVSDVKFATKSVFNIVKDFVVPKPKEKPAIQQKNTQFSEKKLDKPQVQEATSPEVEEIVSRARSNAKTDYKPQKIDSPTNISGQQKIVSKRQI